MTAKEKALELTIKFSTYVDSEIAGENGFEFCKDTKVENSKKCALICVDEIIKDYNYDCDTTKFWEEVKQEIEKL